MNEYFNKKKRQLHNLANGRKYWSPSSQQVLTKYGNSIIYKVEINRAVLSSALMKTLNVASMGTFGKEMEKKNIDDLYHLSMYLHTNNGVFKLEKEAVPHLNKTDRKPTQKNQSFSLPCKEVSLQQFIKKN
jgi:hypothetical protein